MNRLLTNVVETAKLGERTPKEKALSIKGPNQKEKRHAKKNALEHTSQKP